MASSAVRVLEQAMYTGSSDKGLYWAFVHPNPDAPPQTYRLTRRSKNGWTLLLAASQATKEVLSFFAENGDDQQAVTDSLKWLGIPGQIQEGPDGIMLTLANGQVIKSQLFGGEKPKKERA